MKVLITSRIPGQVVSLIESEHKIEINELERPMDRPDLLERVRDKEGLLCTISDRIDEELLANAPLLKMIANYGVGYDHIDVAGASRRGIPVSNTPGVLTDATADLTFALILAVARRVVEGDQRTRKGQFRFWAPLLFLGRQVTGKTLGIIGFGQIGQAVAKRAIGFDMRVLYHSRRRMDPPTEQKFSAQVQRSGFAAKRIGLCIIACAADRKDSSHDRLAGIELDETIRLPYQCVKRTSGE